MNTEKYIGIMIKRARKELGWSQEELSEIVNLSRATISNIERGNCRACATVIAEIFDSLDLDIRLLSDLIKHKHAVDQTYLDTRERIIKRHLLK